MNKSRLCVLHVISLLNGVRDRKQPYHKYKKHAVICRNVFPNHTWQKKCASYFFYNLFSKIRVILRMFLLVKSLETSWKCHDPIQNVHLTRFTSLCMSFCLSCQRFVISVLHIGSVIYMLQQFFCFWATREGGNTTTFYCHDINTTTAQSI